MSRSKGTRSIQKSINDKLSTYCHTSRYVAQVEIFPYYQYLFNKDDAFNINQISDLEFDAEEVGFLLGESSDSALVKQLIEGSKNKETDKKEEKSKSTKKENEKESSKKPEKKPDPEESEETKGLELKQKNLTDF
jgi:hypothetical protein